MVLTDPYKEAFSDLPPEKKKILGQLIFDSLYAGADRPDPSLVNSGYERYEKREKEFLEFEKLASEFLGKV